MSNAQTVQNIYAAFGRGDVPAILAQLADDVAWDHGQSDSGIPWLQPRTGRADISGFFHALGALEFRKFEPTTILENGNVVVALIDLEAAVKATARVITERDEVHIWRFNPAGQVAGFSHKVDSYQHWRALQA